ncbi:GDSL esterase/lipase 1-like [Prosopis cineraria]|uniref:GDSL esterase/lipase 1-like n=1 Tax=Prosopis cineraria TaxID=364024 RepID=UPI002410457C|nr:GDSL esterase/lipase 1-like [Prosopis cineraria]
MASMRLIYVYLMVLFVKIRSCYGMSKCLLPEKNAGLYVFGDSLFDAGMNNYINTTSDYQSNFPPYGQTFFHYPSGRASDGRVIPDFIAEHAKLPLIFPYMHPDAEQYYTYGVNFASGGSGALVETAQGLVVDLHTQVSYYKNVRNVLRKKMGNEEAKTFLSGSVHLFSVGSNDYGARFVTKSSVLLRYSKQQFVDIVIGNLTNAIKEIYNLGGRKFAFVNIGPIGCTPVIRYSVKGNKCNEDMTESARLHNVVLPRMLQKLEKKLAGFKYSVFDFYTSASQLMKHPSKYGFKEGQVACCGGGAYRGDDSCGGRRGTREYELCENVNEYVFFDSPHLTDKANHHISNLMWSSNLTFIQPYNLKQLFQL